MKKMKKSFKKILGTSILILNTGVAIAQANTNKQIIFERYDGNKLNQSCVNKILNKSLSNIQNNENAYAYKMNLNENHPRIIDMEKNQPIVKFFSKNEPDKVLYGLMNEYNVYIYKNGNKNLIDDCRKYYKAWGEYLAKLDKYKNFKEYLDINNIRY